MKNKLFVFSTALILALGLTACGEKAPTAEELVANCMPENKSISADMLLTLDASMSMAELGSDATMDMGLELGADIVGDSDTVYMDGKVKVNFFGFSDEEAVKSYAVTDDKEITRYQYDEETDSWTYEKEKNDDSTGILDISEYEFKDLALQEIKKDDTEYVVTAKIDSESFDALGDMSMDDMIDTEDAEDMAFDVTLKFDKKTKYLTSLRMEVKEYETEEMDIDEFSLELSNINWNDDDISVPKDILESATELLEGDDMEYGDVEDSSEAFTFSGDEFESEEETLISEAPEESEESIEEESAAVEPSTTSSVEESSASESATSTEVSSVKDVEIRISERAQEYGGKSIYIMGINNSDSDKTVLVNLDLSKNGVTVESLSGYIDMEAGTYNVEEVYVDDDYDNIKYTVEEQQVWNRFLGKDIDIDYAIDTDNEKIYGTITNNTQYTLSYPQVKFVVFDSNKEVVYFQETYAEEDTVGPGGTSTFETYIDYDGNIDDFTFFVVADEN